MERTMAGARKRKRGEEGKREQYGAKGRKAEVKGKKQGQKEGRKRERDR